MDTGIWIGQESAGNWDLRIIDCVIERNHMYGIQLADTIGFEVRGCTIQNNPVVSKAGLGESDRVLKPAFVLASSFGHDALHIAGILDSRDGSVVDSKISSNANNIVVRNAGNISISSLKGCDLAFNNQICGDPKQYKMMDKPPSCPIPVANCILPETPY